MSRPLALTGFTALAVLALAAAVGPDLPLWAPILCGCLGVAALIFLFVIKRRLSGELRPGAFSAFLKTAAAVLLTCGLFLGLYLGRVEGEMRPAEGFAGKEAHIRATVLDYPRERYHRAYYLLRVEEIVGENIHDKYKSFTVRASSGQPFACEPDDVIECNVKLYTFTDKGLYSGKNSYWADGIALGGYVIDHEEITVIPRLNRSLRGIFARLRHSLARGFRRSLPGEETGLLRAMLLGEQDQVSDEAYSDFRTIGSSHLLVVSGIHVSVIAGFLSLLLKQRLPLPIRNALLGLGVVLYLLVVGSQPSALRGGIMLLIFLLGSCLGRDADGLNSLGAAVLLICLKNPFSGGDLGLALSVLGTLGILLWADGLQAAMLSRFREGSMAARLMLPAAASLSVTLSVMLATLPLQLAVFGGVSLAAPLANLILTFPSALLLYGAFLGALLYATPFAPLSRPLFLAAGWLARFVLWAAGKLAGLPFAFFSLRDSPILLATGILAALAVLLLLLWRSKMAGRLAVSAAVLLYTCGGFLGAVQADGRVTFLTAADSSCVLAVKGDRAAVLSLGGYNTGLAASLLARANVRRIDTLCLPLRDGDAREAAVLLLKRYPAERLALPIGAYTGRDLTDAAEASERIFLKEGDSFPLLEGVAASAEQGMGRICFTVYGVSVIVETADSGAGECQVLFTGQKNSKINSAFTILQNDAILEGNNGGPAELAGLSRGTYILPGEEGLAVDVLPGGSVSVRGDSLCLN